MPIDLKGFLPSTLNTPCLSHNQTSKVTQPQTAWLALKIQKLSQPSRFHLSQTIQTSRRNLARRCAGGFFDRQSWISTKVELAKRVKDLWNSETVSAASGFVNCLWSMRVEQESNPYIILAVAVALFFEWMKSTDICRWNRWLTNHSFEIL